MTKSLKVVGIIKQKIEQFPAQEEKNGFSGKAIITFCKQRTELPFWWISGAELNINCVKRDSD